MDEQPTRMEQQLFDYYDGRLDEAEAARVKAWIEASEENRRTARRICSLLLALDVHRARPLIDVEGALENVRRRRSAGRNRGFWLRLQQVAAVLFIPLLAFALWQQFGQRDGARVVRTVEVRATPGMVARFTLPDSTRVVLNSSSVLRYPETFEGDSRQVQLSGEAYFEVTRNDRQGFVVHTPGRASVEVHGTHFNVEAYPADAFITTTLTEGCVSFCHTTDNGGEICTPLSPGQKLVYNVKTNELWRLNTTGVAELSWTEGRIVFDNTLLGEALHMLRKRFHVKFVIKDPQLFDDRFTGTFRDQPLEQILKHFEISTHIRWRFAKPDGTAESEEPVIEIY